MTKIIFNILFFIAFLISCTNPEVEFPKEDLNKKDKEEKIIFKNPVIFVYDKPLESMSFYYIITTARANEASESMLRPVKIENLKTELESIYQFYGTKIILISFGKDINSLEKENKGYNRDIVEKYIFVGNKKCITDENTDIIEASKNKDLCVYEPFEYQKLLKDPEFIKTIIKKISEGDNIKISLKEEVILLKGKTFPDADISLISIDENKKEKTIFSSKSDIAGYFGSLILTPRDETIIKIRQKENEVKIRLIGVTNSYSYLDLTPDLTKEKYIKLLFRPIYIKDIAEKLKIEVKEEEKNLNIDTIIINEKGSNKYKIENNVLYIYSNLEKIEIEGLKLDIKEKGVYYVF